MTHPCLYVSLQGEDRIAVFRIAPASGELMHAGDLSIPGGPAPLAWDSVRGQVFAGLRGSRRIARLQVAPEGALTCLQTVALEADPCYLSLDRSRRFLLAAYYAAGKVSSHAIEADGSLREIPVGIYPTAEHAHCIQTDAANQFAWVPHTLPANLTYVFRFDADSGRLEASDPPVIQGEAGAGPRHYTFHPRLDLLYMCGENGSVVTVYRFERASGALTPLQTVSTLPPEFRGGNTAAKIHLHPSGRFLYVSNRGHDSIVWFDVNPNDGLLHAAGWEHTEPVPRAFALHPSGHFLYVAGLGSGRLAGYHIDSATGSLKHLATYVVGRQPMWVLCPPL
jgi:6-phosphogluconolactonase